MKRLLVYMIIAIAAIPAAAQKNPTFVNYIDTYREMAIDQMRRHHVPASITLAQGILESAAGQSFLATVANNHFGIKTGSAWGGEYVTKDDDRTGEKFRKYLSPEESYEDHSLFLRKQRYMQLFDLEPTDYRGWAYGLKAAGYATNPQYPALLIKIIEDYDLAQYDRMASGNYIVVGGDSAQQNSGIINTGRQVYVNGVLMDTDGDFILVGEDYECPEAPVGGKYTYKKKGKVRYVTHQPRINNGIAYVFARQGDSFASIGIEFGINPTKLAGYNEIPVYANLKDGDIVYLTKKNDHVAYRLRGKYHQVKNGESIYLISQCYGIKFSQLYRWNRLPEYYMPKVGDLLRVE